jgi:alkane 1-monooxygenase
VPALDALAGEDFSARQAQPHGSVAGALLRWAPHGFIIGYTACIALVVSALHKMTLLEVVVACYSVGMIGSIGIVAAHELVHKSTAWEKTFGRLGLADVCYLHFEIAHIRGHHVQVGTPNDESTAWRGESLYSFVFRTVPRCLRLAWRLEARRLGKKSESPWSAKNLMLHFAFFQLFYLGAVFVIGGWQGVAFFIVQSAIAIFMLETVSYVEHYGLLRQSLTNERFGNMTPAHSWDSYHRFSNYLEFHLQRHADHHTTPTKSYSELQIEPIESPRLPAGYPIMVTLALAPPLWRWIMDPKIPEKVSG